MTDTITLEPRDQLNVRINAPRSVCLEISDEFSFFAKGYKFQPMYKAGRWDGKIRMFNLTTRLFPRGLVTRLKEWALERDYPVIIEEGALSKELNFDETYIRNWLKDWQKFGTKEPLYFQVEAVVSALIQSHILLLSPTGSGKSYIQYMIIRFLLEHNSVKQKLLLTVPSITLVDQMYDDFHEYSEGKDWNPAEFCQRVHGKEDKTLTKKIVISTWQTASKQPPSWLNAFSVYLCDEAHMAKAKEITSIINALSRCVSRIGFTGTLDGTELHSLEMQSRFGNVVRVADTKQLQDEGILAELAIEAIVLNYPLEETRLVKNMEYKDELNYVLAHEKRNKFLVKLALTQKKGTNTIMLFNRKGKHGYKLKEMLEELAPRYDKKILYIDGDVHPDTRKAIRKQLEVETDCILLGTFGCLEVGFSVKQLHSLIFCHPYKAQIKTLQAIGRILRKLGDKKTKLFDVGDNLTFVSRTGKKTTNKIYNHFVERLKIYTNEGWNYKMVNLNL